MDDHGARSLVRNELADALKCLLQPGIMTQADFRESRGHVVTAFRVLDGLIGGEQEVCALPDDWGTRLLGPVMRAYFSVVRK
jgi:hypothetical protein